MPTAAVILTDGVFWTLSKITLTLILTFELNADEKTYSQRRMFCIGDSVFMNVDTFCWQSLYFCVHPQWERE